MEESVPRAYTLDAATLKELVRARRCSWKAVAKACGVHPGTVKKWVAGKQAIFADNLAKLASFLGCTINQLTGEEPICPQPSGAKQQPTEGHGLAGGNMALATAKGTVSAEIRETTTTIEIIVVGDKKSWSADKLADIYEFILQHLQSKGFDPEKERIVYKRVQFGSITVTFEMPEEWARELVRAAKNKELDAAGIVDAEIKEQATAEAINAFDVPGSEATVSTLLDEDRWADVDKELSERFRRLPKPEDWEILLKFIRQRLTETTDPRVRAFLRYMLEEAGVEETAQELAVGTARVEKARATFINNLGSLGQPSQDTIWEMITSTLDSICTH